MEKENLILKVYISTVCMHCMLLHNKQQSHNNITSNWYNNENFVSSNNTTKINPLSAIRI